MGKTLGYGEITVANMTEPFTVMLTNEAQQFATDSNRKVTSTQSYYTDIIVIRGSQERTDYTIGNITSGSGITVSKNSKRVTFSVSAGTTIGADAGVIEIPITLDGQTIKKQFSWSCGKQGPQGVKGQDGNSFSWNLLQDSSFPVGTKKWNLSNGFSVCTDVKYNGYNSIKIVNQEDVRLDVPSTYFSDYTTSQDLYLTFWIMCPDVSKITNSVDSWIGFRKGYVFLPNGAIARKISKDEFEKAGNNNWFKISISAKSDDIESTTCTFMLQPNNSQATFYVACPMLSRGAIEVPYAPHPDDLIGETGKSVSKITEYYLATSASSGVTYSTSGWSTDPTTQKLTTTNKYLWNCKITEYDDGTKSQPTTPVMCGTYGETGKNGADGDSFAWNMLSETNCGKKHWGTESSGGKYSVEDFITEDNINAVKLICTEGISTSNWSYVLFKDIKMLKQLKPSTKYTLSYDIKANRSGAISHSICKGDVSNFCTNTVVVNNIIGNETWQHISVVLTTNDLKTTPTNEILYLGRNALSKVGYSIIKNLKLVEGDIDTPWSPSQSDIEGKGVVETVQYYLATSQASGVTSSTSGWSTDITTQKLTADKKYLWNCYQTKYSDGTSEPISTPKVIGVYGDKGTSTKIIRTSYEYTQTNIDKFSTSGYSEVWRVNDATTGLKVGDSVLLKVKNTTKGSDCLIFANITAIPSNYSLTCTSYGVIDNGSDGQDGAGFHWNLLKYSGDLSKQVLGGAGTYTATVESIEDKTTPSGQAEKITYTVQGTGGKFIQTGKYIKEGNIKQGKTYTVSVWCKCSSIKSTGVINAEFLDNKTYVNPTLSTEWQQYVVTGVANKDVTSTSSASAISFYYNDNMSVGDIFYISSPKVEEGDKASPWCTTYEETLAKNLTITPSSQYFKSTDGGKTFAPNTITIKPTIQGEISFGKWQYSIDGGVSFADVVSGQKGLTVSNNVLTVSKDSSLYSDAVTMVTFRAVANGSSFYDTCSIAKIYDVSDIGDGRNLWITRDNITLQACEKDKYIYTTTGTSAVCIGATGSSVGTNTIALQTGTKYTISFVISSPSEVGNAQWYFCTALNSTGVKNYGGYGVKLVTGENIVSQTITVDTSCDTAGLVLYNLPTGCVIKDIQVEKGSSPTGWTPAPEDLQTAILSTKSEISDVSLKVDKNKQAIEQRVEKTTYEQDLTLVKGDINKANEGLNKWRYEIYPKSLFASEYQGKSTMNVFAKNTNLTPSQSVLINDTDLSIAWNYAENYIGYALTFTKFSAAKSVAITFAHDDRAHIYLNGKLIGGSDAYNKNGESLTLGFVKGWNCIEVVVNEGASTEGFKLGTTISAISECQLMNCYYGTPVARQSHITNQLVENTTNIEGVTTTMQKVMTTVGGSDRIDEFVNNYNKTIESEKQFKKTIGETYTTKDDFNGLEIGGRNLLLYSQTIRAHKDYYGVGWLTDEVETFNGCPVWSVKNQWGRLTWLFKSHVIDRGLVKVGDTLTYSLYAKTNNASGKSINCSYRFKGNANAYWFNGSAFNVGTNWTRYSVTFTITKDMLATDTYMTEIGFEETASMSGDDKVYYACPKLERGTKATDYTPALEDNEINGQNLVSNLSSNWEQGSVSYVANSTYASIKTVLDTRLRTEDVFSVSGNVTISAGTSTNSSKEELNFYYVLFDVNKKAIGVPASGSEWQSLTSPKIINCGDAKYMAIILRWGSGSTVITPSNISQICLKIERGTSATPFTLAPEDVNGKIVNVETIANQTANKFEWIVKSGDSSSNFTLTDRVADLVAERINFKGLVTFSGLNTDAKNEIGKVAQSKVDGLEVGGRNLLKHSSMIGEKLVCDNYVGCNNCDTKEYTNEGFHIITPTEGNANNGIAFSFDNFTILGINGGDTITFSCDIKGTSDSHAPFISIHISDNNWYGSDVIQKNTSVSISSSWQRVSVTITTPTGLSKNHMWLAIHGNYQSDLYVRNFKLEKGNKATDWTPAPEDVSQDATNKASQALTDAKNYSSNAVNWVTSNGSSTTSLNSMVKKWTDGAVSDTAQINGGWIKANTITASKIALADFTNYSQLTRDTAATYGFAVTDDTDGTWFSTQGIRRDQFISETFPCNGGESYLIEYDISTNAKGANNSTDTKNYIGVAIGVYGYTGTVGSNGLPNKATNIWYATRVTGSEAATVTHVKTTITTSTATKQFRIFLQSNGYYFEGTTKIRNLSVRRMYGGTLIVDGSITADKIATDAIKSRNYISSGGTQGSFLNLSDGSFTSPNLSWDSNGNLIAKNANLSGQITATKGSIGGWSVDNYSIYTTYDADQNIFGSGISGTKGKYVLWAGETNNAIGANRSSDTPTDASLVIYNNGGLEVRKTMVGNDKKNHLYTTILQSGQINLKMDDNYIGTITATDTISSNSTVTMSHVSMAAKKGYGWSILHTDDSGNLISDIQRDPSDTKIKINSPITVSSTDISKYNAIETTGDVVVSGKIHANYGSNKIQLNPDNNGSIELYGYTPFIDFHYGNSDSDYTSRIIAQEWGLQIVGTATVTGDLYCDAHIYTCTNGHFSWAGQTDAYLGCGNYSGGNNIYYYANYHAFYVNNDSGSGMMYINTNGVTSRVGFTKTSDERIKKNFESFDDNIIDAYMNIEPVKYQLKQSSNDNYHFGFKAQHVDKVFSDYGDTYNESFDICTSRPIDPDKAKELYGVDDMTEEYGLRYDELIAPTTYMVQHIYKELESTKGELAKVKQEKADLETRLQAIEAKLGL